MGDGGGCKNTSQVSRDPASSSEAPHPKVSVTLTNSVTIKPLSVSIGLVKDIPCSEQSIHHPGKQGGDCAYAVLEPNSNITSRMAQTLYLSGKAIGNSDC